jgi:hypothetical protein
LEQTFQCLDDREGLPKKRQLQLGEASARVAFNENYDRTRLAVLCKELKSSEARKAEAVADGLTAQLFTKKLTLSGAAKAALHQLAELCEAGTPSARHTARNISRELFFGYVLQKSDFQGPERGR